MNRISYACRIQKRHANSILSRYSKKELTPETTKSEFVLIGQAKVSRDEWNKMNNLEKSRLFLDNRERTEITDSGFLFYFVYGLLFLLGSKLSIYTLKQVFLENSLSKFCLWNDFAVKLKLKTSRND